MAYCVSSCVAALCPHLTSGASDFASGGSTPNQGQVNAWLSAGSNIIDSKLATKGYDAIGVGSGAYQFAAMINADYGAYRAELSMLSARVSKLENSRADVFRKSFWDALNDLVTMDLSQMGVTRGLAPPANYTGGISVADKTDNDNDPDIVQPRFARGQFVNPWAVQPSQIENEDFGGGDDDDLESR